MNSLIITHSGFQDQEVVYPYYRLREEGHVVTVAETTGRVRGILGSHVSADVSLADFSWAHSQYHAFDLLVIPGGVKALEKLRLEKAVIEFVYLWVMAGKPTAAICSGAQLLITARVLEGRRIAAYPAMAVDVENAGATFVNEPVVVDQNLVTSPHYDHLATWLITAISLITP